MYHVLWQILTLLRIIQDCEDALTNWVPQKAAVSSSLSQRSRNLSQRRASRSRDQEAVDLSHQDAPMDRESFRSEYEDEEEHEHQSHHDTIDHATKTGNGEQRGRDHERITETA